MTTRRQARGKGTLSARDAGSVPSDPYSTRPTHRLSVGRQELGGSHRGAIRGPPLFIARVRWIEHSEGVSRLLATDGSINGRLMASNASSTRR